MWRYKHAFGVAVSARELISFNSVWLSFNKVLIFKYIGSGSSQIVARLGSGSSQIVARLGSRSSQIVARLGSRSSQIVVRFDHFY